MLVSLGFLSIASANSPFAQNNAVDSNSSITKSDGTDTSEGKCGDDEDAETSEEDSDQATDDDTEEDVTDADEDKEEGKCGG